MMKITIYTDGASRGNPGLAACAWLILEGDNVLEADSAGLGQNTNNVAEYTALIHALKAARKFCDPETTEIQSFSDSELMIRQMNGEYAVKSPALMEKYAEAKQLAKEFAAVSFTHVKRENPYISSCDWMCNQALDMLRQREAEKKALPNPVCTPIGIVHSPYKEKGSAPRQGRLAGEISELEIFPQYAKGLQGLTAGDDIFVLCWLDRSERNILEVKPHGNSADGKNRGVFSTRAPVRPNPISLTLVKLLEIEGTKLKVKDLEMLDNTPVLDIKPYYQDTDSPA